MPRYKLTAPDGRTVIVSGDSAPTEADAQQIFSSLSSNPQPEQATEQQKQAPRDGYGIAADIIGAGTSVLNPAAQAVERGAWGSLGVNANKLNAAFDASTQYVGNKLTKAVTGRADIIPADSKYNNTGVEKEAGWRDYYNRALNSEQRMQQKFQQEHPYINTGLEIAGSMKAGGNILGKALGAEKAGAAVASKLAPSIGQKWATVLGKSVAGAISGGSGGAVYGFGTTNGNINDRLKGALRGAEYGAAIGGALPPAWQVTKDTVKGAGKLLAELVGKTSGAGAKSVERAYDAGIRNSQVFKDAMRGNSSVYDVVDDVDNAVKTLERNASAKYKSMLPENSATLKLSDTQFENALKTATDSISGVTAGVDDTAANAINKVHKLAQNIKANGGLTFDNALEAKKAIDGIIEPLSRAGEKNAVRLLTPIKNALNETMEKAIPEYGGARAAFRADTRLIDSIKSALTSKDPTTELRKLQGITRQSVAAAQGGKQELGKLLDKISNGRILDAVAGGQVVEKMPRDALRLAGVGAIGAGAVAHPTTLLALPATSPRLVGETAYALGQVAGLAGNKLQPVINALGKHANKVPVYPISQALGYALEEE